MIEVPIPENIVGFIAVMEATTQKKPAKGKG